MIERTVAVGGGKGGVGKSTVSLNLALALADRGTVGLLDADLYGPSIAEMVGLRRREWSRRWDMTRGGRIRTIAPLEHRGLRIMSFGFVLGEDQPMLLEAAGLNLIVHQLAHQIDWGDLDYLVVDLPPGTGDVQQVLLDSLSVSGALVVVTPQAVAHLDGRKAASMYLEAGVRILGGVENMSAMRCPHCGDAIEIFPRAPAERSLWAMDVEKLVSIPVDPRLATDESARPGLGEARSPARDAFADLAEAVATRLAEQGEHVER